MLTALETDGTVTRTRGGRPGIPDTWTLTTPAQPAAGPGPGHDGEPAAQPASAPAGERPGRPRPARSSQRHRPQESQRRPRPGPCTGEQPASPA